MRRIILFLLIIFNVSFAHDMWVENKNGTYTLFYGHKHPAENEQQFIKYNPSKVKKILCVDEEGTIKNISFKKEYPVKITKQCSILYVEFFSGYWTKTPYGTKNRPKNEVKLPIKSWISYETVKRIDKWNKNLEKPFYNKLEIIPLNNPLKLETGDKLRLLIMFNKKPVKNVAVAYDGKFRGLTDSKGRVNIRIKHKGFQLIEATFKEKINSEKADEIIYTTTLNFEVK